jgi:hypothetical protein
MVSLGSQEIQEFGGNRRFIPYLQQPATCFYPAPNESKSRFLILFISYQL